MATHKELLTALKFDESFKNAMRDYYSYGFKTFKGADKTVADDWKRLNSILFDCLEWKKEKRKSDKKEIIFASVDSQALDQNPFQRLYRFCKYKHLDYFLHTMFAFELEDDFDTGYLERAVDKMAISKKTVVLEGEYCPQELFRIIELLEITDKQKEELKDAVIHGMCLKTAQISNYFPITPSSMKVKEKDKNRTPNNRLCDIEEIGLIECIQGKGRKGSFGDRYWKKRGITISNLLEFGETVNQDFRIHFVWALDFFSKYFSLGEIGLFLLDRINEEYHSVLRFKNEYYMHALNDFNVIDIIGVIERKEWCRISYQHGIKEQTHTELLCFPLEIRTSSATGRQTLMVYEPFHRSCTGLRIEFIDEIFCYNDKDIRCILKKTGVELSEEEIDSDIGNARERLKYTWGVSTSKEQLENVVEKPVLQHVSIGIAYEDGKDFYILNRLKREKRNGRIIIDKDRGVIKYEVDVTDPMEMRPWIRSFYSRVLFCEGIHFSGKSFEYDVDEIINKRDVLGNSNNLESENRELWRIPDEAFLGDGIRARDHEKIFHGIFSVYSYIILGVIEAMGFHSKEITPDVLDECIKETIDIYTEKCGQQTKKIIIKEIRDFILNNGFVHVKDDKYFPVYHEIKSLNWYESMIPFTVSEIRWMKSILSNEKITYFFTDKEVEALKNYMDMAYPSEEAFPFEVINNFDRFFFNKTARIREKEVICSILKGTNNSQILHIKYKTMKGSMMEDDYRPIVLEFSKRTNRFQAYVQSCVDSRIYILNVARIEEIQVLEQSFDRDKVYEDYKRYRLSLERQVVICFGDEKNMADRILTEFSPWKKKCVFDNERKIYQLTIYYHETDTLDLVIRFMGYGSSISIDKNHEIAKEIHSRLMKQRVFLEKRRREDERGE